MSKAKAVETTEAQRHTARLLAWGLQQEEIAYRLRVSLNSVIRWKRGVKPHPGHLAALRELVEVVRRERAKAKAS